MTTRIPFMTKAAFILLCPLALLAPRSAGQTTDEAARTKAMAVAMQSALQPPEPKLTKFDLDFPGGTPEQLVSAIQKASARPLNAIIPQDVRDVRLPAMKMSGVDVAHLFPALTAASHTNALTNSVNGQFYSQIDMGFTVADGKLSDDSIWYFFLHSQGPREAVTNCKFFSLAPFLDEGLTVDDITTAIQTGWKMSGNQKNGNMSFHKETKLLIVVGTDFQLRMVGEALTALPPKKSKAPEASPKSEGK